MGKLVEHIQEAPARRNVVADCEALIASEVKAKRGISGALVKTAYALVRAVKPGIIPEVVNALLDDFAGEIDPHIDRFASSPMPGGLEAFLPQNGAAVSESLLAVTDQRAKKADNRTLIKAYQKLRPKGKEHVSAALPGLGRLLDKNLGDL